MGFGQFDAGRLSVKQLQGLGDGHPGLGRLAAVAQHLGEAGERATRAPKVVLGTEPRDRFLVGMLGLYEFAGLTGGFGRFCQDPCAVRVLLGVKRQGLLVVRPGLGDVQGHCAIPGKD